MKKEVIGTLWVSTDKQGRTVVSGKIREESMYGYVNEVDIKKGKNAGKKGKNIKLYAFDDFQPETPQPAKLIVQAKL